MTNDQYFDGDEPARPRRETFESPDDFDDTSDVDEASSESDESKSTEPHVKGDDEVVLDEVLNELADPLDLLTLTAERDEYLDALRRLQADFDNYRKRMLRQQSENMERAAAGLTERLLPVLDAIDLALVHGDSDQPGDSAGAMSRVGALLSATLEKEGLERIDAVNVAFDPTIHDAVAQDVDEDDSSDDENDAEHKGHGLVTEVLRSGYRLKGSVLRPAMVKVRS